MLPVLARPSTMSTAKLLDRYDTGNCELPHSSVPAVDDGPRHCGRLRPRTRRVPVRAPSPCSATCRVERRFEAMLSRRLACSVATMSGPVPAAGRARAAAVPRGRERRSRAAMSPFLSAGDGQESIAPDEERCAIPPRVNNAGLLGSTASVHASAHDNCAGLRAPEVNTRRRFHAATVLRRRTPAAPCMASMLSLSRRRSGRAASRVRTACRSTPRSLRARAEEARQPASLACCCR